VALLAGCMGLIAPAGAVGAVVAPGTLEIIAGIPGQSGFPTGIPGPGTSLTLQEPLSVAVDAHGNTYVADYDNGVVEKLTPSGTLSIFAGNQADTCTRVVPGPATATGLCEPTAVAVDSHGNVFIADNDYQQVYKVTPAGILSVAVASGVGSPQGLAVDSLGDLYVSNDSADVIHKITPSGVNTIFAGGGSAGVQPGPATASQLNAPANLAVDSADNLYIADSGNNAVEKVTPAGVLSIVAGTGSTTTPPSNLDVPFGVAVDSYGNVYIADQYDFEVEKVTPAGVVTVVAGNGNCGRPPVSGLPATDTYLFGPADVAFDPQGDLIIADTRIGDGGLNASLVEKVYGVSPPPPTPPPSTSPGYWLTGADGGVFSFGPAFFGSTGGLTLNQPIVGVASTPDGKGYWTVARDGGVFSFGDASFQGSLPGRVQVSDIVGMATDPATGGYWLVGSDGGVYAFGAPFEGSLPATSSVSDIVGMASTPDGKGYYLVGADGAVTPFGDGTAQGEASSIARLNAPIVGITVDPSTGGYWLAGADGGVYAYGAPFLGSAGALHLSKPVVGISATADGTGYVLGASDGGVFAYGTPFEGSMGGTHLDAPVVGISAAGTAHVEVTMKVAKIMTVAGTRTAGPHC
jgi:hypothetical protein